MDVLAAMGSAWGQDRPLGSLGPLCVILLEDFAKFDRSLLRSLFQTLAEGQHR